MKTEIDKRLIYLIMFAIIAITAVVLNNSGILIVWFFLGLVYLFDDS